MPVLVLNASYEPVNITRARRALVLLIKGAAVIEETHDRYVHVGLQLPCVACFASRIVRWVQFPTRSTKFRQSRMRGRYAPLKTERAAFNSLGWYHGE